MHSKLRSTLLDSEHSSHSGVALPGKTLLLEQLERSGYCWIFGQQYFLSDEMRQYWTQLCGGWNQLIPDRFLSDGGKYRERRLGKYYFYPSLDRLEKQHIEGYYYQASAINKANGGIKRKFGPLEDSFADNPLLHSFIRLYYSLLPLPDHLHAQGWLVYVHPFRILASPGKASYPTPEGIHRDGHLFTVQVFVNRTGVEGAESQVWSEDEQQLLFAKTFSSSLDTLIIDDERCKHCVTPLYANSDQQGTRDIFTVNFNLIDNYSPTRMY